MNKLTIGIITLILAVAVIAQQTLPTRDGAVRIPNGSGYVDISSDTSGNATIAASNAALAVTGALAVSTTLSVGGGTAMAKILTATATLNFPSTGTNASSDLAMTLTGAAANDIAFVSPPFANTNANSCYTVTVNEANIAVVRFNNYSIAAIDPASGTFRVTVIKY